MRSLLFFLSQLFFKVHSKTESSMGESYPDEG